MRNRSSWKSVRCRSSEELHALAGQLRRLQTTEDLSEGRERLWTQLVAELEWRSSRKRSWCKRCSCDLCQDPFDGP